MNTNEDVGDFRVQLSNSSGTLLVKDIGYANRWLSSSSSSSSPSSSSSSYPLSPLHRYDVIDSALPYSAGEQLKMCLLVKTSLGRIRRFNINHHRHHHQHHRHHHCDYRHHHHHHDQVAAGPVSGSWTVQFLHPTYPHLKFSCYGITFTLFLLKLIFFANVLFPWLGTSSFPFGIEHWLNTLSHLMYTLDLMSIMTCNHLPEHYIYMIF